MARLVGLLVCLAACGNITRKGGGDDAGVRDDARMIDASQMADAAIDGQMAAPPPPGQEIVPGGVRMTGPTYRMQGQLGHPVEQKKAAGPTYTIQGNAVVKP